MSVLFSNSASTTLSAGVGDSATSITVADGSVFPAITGSDYFYLTLEVDSDPDLKEIVKCTARSGNTLTIARGQDGTSARTFSTADKAQLRLTAAGLNDVATQADTDTTYSVQDGELSQNNFTDADHTKLDGIAASANNYSHPSAHAISFITGLQTALDGKVDDSQVLTNVPANALFTDTNTTYSVGDGGLSQINFTSADHTKLNGIEASATADQTAAQIKALLVNGLDATHLVAGAVGASEIGNDVVNSQHYADNSIDALHLNVSGNGTTSQYLRSDGDGTFSWVTPPNTNTTYSVGNGGLTQQNFTNADHTKLDGISANARTGTMVENGTSFGGTYPVTFRISTNNYYSHTGLQFTGSTNTLAVAGGLNVGGVIDANGGQGGINITNSSILSAGTSAWTGDPSTSGKIQYHSNRWYIVSDSSSNRIVQFRRNGSDKSYIDNNGLYVGNVSGSSGSCTGNAATASNADTVDGIQGASLLRSDAADTFTSLTGTTLTASGHICAAGTDNGIGFWGGINSYYIKMGNNQANHGTVTDYSMHHNMGTTIGRGFTFGNSRTSVKCSINANTGAILSSNNITAYSDIRVKDNIEIIPNALDKVSQLSGYTFTRTDVDDKEQKYTGVIAQEVLAVLPEAVQLGATEEDTMSVAYGNMVGLLIESIKELKAEVEDLKAEIETLKRDA